MMLTERILVHDFFYEVVHEMTPHLECMTNKVDTPRLRMVISKVIDTH